MVAEIASDIASAFNARLAIYRQKRGRANPLAEESYNRHEALCYVIEAIELLARESGLAELVPCAEDDG